MYSICSNNNKVPYKFYILVQIVVDLDQTAPQVL